MDRILIAMMVFPFRPSRKKVLEALNTARTALGMSRLDSLPAGTRGKLYSCPVSRSLSRMVGVDGVCFQDLSKATAVAEIWRTDVRQASDRKYIVSLPEILRRFVRDFDLGAYPRLLVEEATQQNEAYRTNQGFQPTIARSNKPAA